MASQEHKNISLQGRKKRNTRKSKNSQVTPDFVGMDLSNANLKCSDATSQSSNIFPNSVAE